MFSGWQPRQDVKFSRRFGTYLRPHLGVLAVGTQHSFKMGTELVPETSENLHILTWLSARENFIEFCTEC
jgi:hypothetical protein